MSSFDHIEFPVGHLAISSRFYREILATLGWSFHNICLADGIATYGYSRASELMLWARKDDEPLMRIHLAFVALSRKQVNDFYEVALKTNGQGNGPPGFRNHYGPNYYAAFVLDPDGNNIEALYRGE